MRDDVAIKVDRVSKTFRLPHEKNNSVKGAVVNFYKRNKTYEVQRALSDISFEVKKGEFFGIVGRNGSGKSTLLKMLAGIYSPSKGRITVNGKLTPFIELGVGFNPELTGRENVFLNGALLGFNRKEMSAMYEEIVEFAELERFMDQKLKNYSSGMQVRLAFSIAIRAKSDILVLDEVLAVGDAAFQSKCFDYFYELQASGTTVILVSHDRTSLERFCTRGVLIDKGLLVYAGEIQKVLQEYSSVVLEELNVNDKRIESKLRDKSAPVKIVGTSIVNSKGKVTKKVRYGEDLRATFEVHVTKSILNPVLGVTIKQKNVNVPIFATNTLIEGNKNTGDFKKGDVIYFEAHLPKLLNDGEYYVEPAIANEAGTIMLDQIPKAFRFLINGSHNPYSVLSVTENVSVKKNDK